MTNPFFSVIITTYNRAKLLKVALKSLDLQSFKDYEAFIIDDSSTDNTPEIIGTFNDHSNWHFIKLIENRGYPYCKNLAFTRCKGKFITFLDSDDIWLPDRLEKFYETAQKNPEAGFIFSDGYILSGNIINSTMFSAVKKIPTGKVPAYYGVSNRYLPYITTNVAIKSEVVKKTGFYREDLKMLGDTEYFVRVIKNYPVEIINKPLSIYRININGNSQITRDWERCIKESEISLLVAEPSEEQHREIMEFNYLQQSNAMIRNGAGKIARKYLKKCSITLKILILYLLSFIPVKQIFLIKEIYQKLKKFYHPAIKNKEFEEINGFFKKISEN